MTRNTILLLISAAVVVLGLGYYFLFFNSSTTAALSSDGNAVSDAELSFIALVSRLDPITFNTELLSDPRFTSRQDIRTTIIPEVSGRKDPFAPIGR